MTGLAGGERPADSAVVPVHYDFASSLCYVAHRVMERMRGELDALGVLLAWTPVDLPRLVAGPWRRGAPLPEERRRHVAAVARALGVPLRPPSVWGDSRPAHAVALALGDPAREAAWRERVWTAIYEEGRALDSSDAVAELARELGLSLAPDALDAGVRRLEALTGAAARADVTGVPTFVLGDWPFGGIQDEGTMQAVLARWRSRRAAARRADA